MMGEAGETLAPGKGVGGRPAATPARAR
jgi:hypothetical protein